VIGVEVAESESTKSWQSFFVSPLQRGLTGVELIISDAHSGLQVAIQSTFIGAVGVKIVFA